MKIDCTAQLPQRLFIGPGEGDLRNQSVVGARLGGELCRKMGGKPALGERGREGGLDKGPGPGLETGDDGKKDQMPSSLSLNSQRAPADWGVNPFVQRY